MTPPIVPSWLHDTTLPPLHALPAPGSHSVQPPSDTEHASAQTSTVTNCSFSHSWYALFTQRVSLPVHGPPGASSPSSPSRDGLHATTRTRPRTATCRIWWWYRKTAPAPRGRFQHALTPR